MNTANFPIGQSQFFYRYHGNVNGIEVIKLPKGTYNCKTFNPFIETENGSKVGGGYKEDKMVLEHDQEVFIRVAIWQYLIDNPLVAGKKIIYHCDGYAKITRVA